MPLLSLTKRIRTKRIRTKRLTRATIHSDTFNASNSDCSLLGKVMLSSLLLSLISVSVQADSLISDTNYLEYELPKIVQEQCNEGQNCPKIEIKYLKTNQDWINKTVNQRINNIIVNSQPSDKPVSKATSDASAKMAIDAFVTSQFAELPKGVSWGYSLMVQPDYLGHIRLGQPEDFELFQINTYVFTGGAHGMPLSEYLVFDTRTQKQVKLDDILLKGKKSRFEALVYKAYKSWIPSVAEDVKDYEKNWPFMLSENVTLTDKGLAIRYQHYDIAPYAYGMPVLTVPYSQLGDIIKPKFIPST